MGVVEGGSYRTTARVRLRSEPSLSGTVAAVLSDEELVVAKGVTSQWVFVQTATGRAGYVHNRYLRRIAAPARREADKAAQAWEFIRTSVAGLWSGATLLALVATLLVTMVTAQLSRGRSKALEVAVGAVTMLVAFLWAKGAPAVTSQISAHDSLQLAMVLAGGALVGIAARSVLES